MKIKISLIIIIIFTILFLSFKKQEDKNEVVFWTLQLGTFNNYFNKLIDDFESNNPDIKIKWVDVPYSEGEKRTLAALLSDNPPDLINLTPDFSAMAAQKNTLYEIPKELLDNFPTSLHESLSYNGKFFAIPFYLTSAVTFANNDLINISNIKTIPKTYDEMYELAFSTNLPSNTYIEMPTINENDTFLKILNKYNINVFTDIESNVSKNIFNTYRTLYQSNLIPKESITQSHRDALEKYMSNQIVFLQAGVNFLNIIKENASTIYENTVVAPQIVGSSNKYDFSLMNLIIPLKAKNKDSALKFAEFLTNEENQLEFAKLTSVLPANKYALSDEYFKKSSTKEETARKISAEQIQNLNSGIRNYNKKKNIILILNSSLVQIMRNTKDINSELELLSKNLSEFNE